MQHKHAMRCTGSKYVCWRGCNLRRGKMPDTGQVYNTANTDAEKYMGLNFGHFFGSMGGDKNSNWSITVWNMEVIKPKNQIIRKLNNRVLVIYKDGVWVQKLEPPEGKIGLSIGENVVYDENRKA